MGIMEGSYLKQSSLLKTLMIVYMMCNNAYMKRRDIPRPDDCCDMPMKPDIMPLAERERTLLIFKALADKTRYDIFRLIAAQDAPVCACDIGDRFDVSQPTIAHHTKVLREAGLITTARQGIWAYYEVQHESIELLQSLFAGWTEPANLTVSIG